MARIRHCVECPKCRTRYLISFSPYGNGSYLIAAMNGSTEEYVLYCSCSSAIVASRWRWSEIKKCDVSRAAYDRGYGAPDEILLVSPGSQEEWPVDPATYLKYWRAPEKRKHPF